jgi:EAL domain-containing protein (putative c-di-GMP-specific phosphodiesterase class I)
MMIGVNVSPRQLHDDTFVAYVEETLERHRIPPTSLCLEITESGFEGLTEEVEVLHQLRELGCFIGMDDFGTGYSSLARLRDLPVEMLKIDRRFVTGLGVDPDDTAIVSAIMSMSLTLGLHVIAEGVERPEQAEALTRLGCPVAQGYLFGRPEPAGVLTSRMTARRMWKPVRGSDAAADRSSSLISRPRSAHRMFIHEFLDQVGVQMEHDGVRGWGRGQRPNTTPTGTPR